jgi:hypothetical protein
MKAATAEEFLSGLHSSGRAVWKVLRSEDLSVRLIDICRRRYRQQASRQSYGLESYLSEIARTPEAQVALMLDALVQEAAPMARIYRLHASWEMLRQRSLLVCDTTSSIFREQGEQQGLNLIDGASELQVICIWTEHAIPIRDLALGHPWQPPTAPTTDGGET